MKKIILVTIWLTILGGLVYYLASHSSELARLLNLSAANTGLLALLFLTGQVLNGAEIMFLMRSAGARLRFWECFHLANITTAANYLPMKGGLLAKAVYFRKKHDLEYLDFADMTIAGLLISFLTIFAAGTLLIIANYFIAGEFYTGLLAVFCAAFLIVLSAAFFLVLFNKKIKWKKLDRIGGGLRRILRDKTLLSRLIGINLLSIMVMGLRFYVSFRVLSSRFPLILSILCGQVKKVTTVIGLIPAGLGISEVSAGAVTDVMKGKLDIGVFAASLDRVVSIIVLLLVGTYSFYYLTRVKKVEAHEKQI